MSNSTENSITKIACIWGCGNGFMVLKPLHIVGTGVTKHWAHCNNCFQSTSYYPDKESLLSHIKDAA